MQCWHMSGAGNDFMVIDARGLTLDFEEMSKELCALSGADGFMAVDYSERADFKLHFYNSDGSRGEMCGNGSRCRRPGCSLPRPAHRSSPALFLRRSRSRS